MPFAHDQGSVYFFPNFIFPNGEKSNKLIILLTRSSKLDELFIFCTTTSKQKYREKKPGCNKDKAYFFIPVGKELFDTDTWLILDILYSFEPIDILQYNFNKKLQYFGRLKKENLQALINCIKKVEDIPEIFLEKII